MLTEKSKADFAFLPLRPRTLISLADMIDFFAAGLAHNWQWLISEKNMFYKKAVESPDGKPTPMERHNLTALLKTHDAPIIIEGKSERIKGWMFYCEQLEMAKSKAVIEHFLNLLNVTNSTPNYSVVDTHLGAIYNSLWFELFERKFTFIPFKKSEFFEQENLFGKKVHDAFPSARSDIKDAGNCRASDLHAATMYHLMCAVNYGLVELARYLRVRIKKTPLEYAEWQTLLDKLKKKMEQKTIRPPGNKKLQSEARKFYNGLLTEFKFFKDLRNDVMHARNDYKAPEIENAYIRVSDFMQRLSEGGVSEPL